MFLDKLIKIFKILPNGEEIEYKIDTIERLEYNIAQNKYFVVYKDGNKVEIEKGFFDIFIKTVEEYNRTDLDSAMVYAVLPMSEEYKKLINAYKRGKVKIEILPIDAGD